MTHLPLWVSLRGRRALVAGAGPVGLRRARTLARAGAEVTVVSPRLGGSLPRGCRLRRRGFLPSDAEGCLMVVVATGDKARNHRIAACAREAGALVNLASSSEASEVWFPAMVRRDPLMIAISTGSSAPTVAKRIRRELSRTYGPAYGGYLRLLEEVRGSVKRRIQKASRRRAVLRSLAAPGLLRLYLKEGRVAAFRRMRMIVGREE